MKQGIIVTSVIAFIGVGVFTYYIKTRDTQEPVETNTANTAVVNNNTNTSSSNSNVSTSSPSTAKYVSYSASALASAQAVSNGYTVLYFHADWCPICQVLDPDISAKIQSLPPGLTILKTDYDTETALKKKYGVTYQHTFVQVDEQGNKLKLWSGTTNASDIGAEIL